MAKFVSIPATIVPFSSKDAAQGIEWAKSYVDKIQAEYPDDVYVTGAYDNLKTNESGQILSTRYAELVQRAFRLPTAERVFLKQIATADQINTVDFTVIERMITERFESFSPSIDITEITKIIDQRISSSNSVSFSTEQIVSLIDERLRVVPIVKDAGTAQEIVTLKERLGILESQSGNSEPQVTNTDRVGLGSVVTHPVGFWRNNQ